MPALKLDEESKEKSAKHGAFDAPAADTETKAPATKEATVSETTAKATESATKTSLAEKPKGTLPI